jgi:ABC-2 type transport system ATP-binding protein
MERILDVKSISKEINGKLFNKNITIFVEPGEMIGLVGPNGAGKTTLFRQIVGLTTPTVGAVTIFGRNITEDIANIMSNVGYLSGEIALPNRMKVKAFLKQMAKIKLVPYIEVIGIAEYFELDLNKKIMSLSKGNKQKVAIVNALMGLPKLLILDEPTTGLDPIMQNKFFTYLSDLKAKGTGIIFSSHLVEEVEENCDFVYRIDKGVLTNTRGEVVQNVSTVKKAKEVEQESSSTTSNTSSDVDLIVAKVLEKLKSEAKADSATSVEDVKAVIEKTQAPTPLIAENKTSTHSVPLHKDVLNEYRVTFKEKVDNLTISLAPENIHQVTDTVFELKIPMPDFKKVMVELQQYEILEVTANGGAQDAN